MDDEVRIRGYDPARGDMEGCRALWAELTERHRRIYDDPSIGGNEPGRQFDEHLERVGPGNVWVAEREGQILGMAGLIPGEGQAELEPLVVGTAHRGKGLGRRLVATVLEAAGKRGLHTATVRPVARNVEAIRFFHRLGFDVLGHLELFVDLRPRETQRWRPGETLAGRQFRV